MTKAIFFSIHKNENTNSAATVIAAAATETGRNRRAVISHNNSNNETTQQQKHNMRVTHADTIVTNLHDVLLEDLKIHCE